MTVHGNTGSTKDWLQFTLNDRGRNLVPCSYIAEPTFYLLVPHDLCNETIIKIQQKTEQLEMEQVRERNAKIKE